MSDHYLETNRQLWDHRVAGHVASTFYDVPGFLAGNCTLNEAELQGLGDVNGKSILHLQCHFGLDTLSLARRGARVVGVDFSHAAMVKAREIADEAGLADRATFIECDVFDLPRHLDATFDLVFASYGVLLWLPDLRPWAALVRRYLKPGGRLVLAEFHPTWNAFNWDTMRIAYPYFNHGKPFSEVSTSSYAGDAALPDLTEYFWFHSLSELMQPLLDEGLRLEVFQEYPYSYYDCFPNLVQQGPRRFVPRDMPEGYLPMMFLLCARRE